MQELAARFGIQTSYVDMAGRRQEASPDTLKAVLELWGISARNGRQVDDALREHEERRWRQAVEPVIVVWDGQPGKVVVRFPSDVAADQVHCRLRYEDERCQSIDARPDWLRKLEHMDLAGCPYEARQLLLPALPWGYHQLELEIRDRVHRALVISAPTRSYSPREGLRTWGLFLPMYAVHSEQSWGAGNLGDWRRFSQWMAAQGGSMISTLPLLAGFLDQPVCEPSPYSPASRLFWNEFYLEIERIPEFATCGAAQRLVRSRPFQQRVEAFRKNPFIDYRAEMAARRQVLESLAESVLKSPRRRAFERYLREQPRVADYAEFRAACDATQTSWHTWPERMRNGKLQPGDYSEKAKRYHAYVQWLAEEQVCGFLQECQADGVQFYLDLPLGVHPDGYDLWRERDAFAFPAGVGAPPDMFFTKGQAWGFPPPHPERMRQRGYSYLLEYLRFQMRHTGLLRLDHVMGLHRLYWIPPGFPPSAGVYVSYPANELHAILSLESHRHRTVLVGENLGTVPPEVNAAMERHHLRQTYVVQYEQRPDPKHALRRPPVRAVASVNTHDMPPFAAHWEGQDVHDRADLGLVPKPKVRPELEHRRKMNAALASFLRRKGCLKTKEQSGKAMVQACLEWLADGPAEMVQVNLEDLWQEIRPQNVPGTSKERPNWRRKTRLTLEEIELSVDLREALASLARLRTASKRKPKLRR